MTIETTANILTFLEIDQGEDENVILVTSIHTEVEKYISNYCRRTFEETSYSLERYSGNGTRTIVLENYPVTYLDRVSIGTRDAIQITNTSSRTTATVSVTSTGLRLVKDGTADSTVTFASNSTINDIVTAVNALGSGWSATLLNSDYSGFVSSELIIQTAKNCINSKYVYLEIPDDEDGTAELDYDTGVLKFTTGFPRGFKNIFIDYTAGYSTSTMPADLKLAVKIICQHMYEKLKNTVFGVDFYNIGASGSTGLRTIFEKEPLPKEAIAILNQYKRVKV